MLSVRALAIWLGTTAFTVTAGANSSAMIRQVEKRRLGEPVHSVRAHQPGGRADIDDPPPAEASIPGATRWEARKTDFRLAFIT